MAVIKYLPGKKSLKSQLKYLEKEGKTLEELKTGKTSKKIFDKRCYYIRR